MGLANAINEAPETLLDELAAFVMSECAAGQADGKASLEGADPAELVSAFKAWAYMHLNDPGGE